MMNASHYGKFIVAALLVSACNKAADQASENMGNEAAVAEASEEASPAELNRLVAVRPTNNELETRPYGTVLRSSIWRNAGWPSAANKDIAVCWENPSPENQALRDSVADAVKQSWGTVSWLSFTGWGRCTADAAKENIRIRIADAGPHVKALGRYLDDYPDGMVLNFTFANWSPSCQQRVDFCSRAVAVHEFGHALGFAHEQNRADAPWECRAERQGTDGDWNITSYDPRSIMNYCNEQWNNDGLLSERDVQAITELYGRRA